MDTDETTGCPPPDTWLVSAHAPLPDAVLCHLDECADCRQLAVMLAQASGEEPETSADGAPPVGALPNGMASLGSRIGTYELEALLGVGGMGIVYRALDLKLGRRVAVKLVRETGDLDDKLKTLMGREARAMAQLSHGNVVQLYELAESGGQRYLVMELVDGNPFRQWLDANPSLAERERVFADMARGLAAIHETGLLHRDIKPSNILIDTRGQAKVGDLGLADLVEKAGASGGLGTPLYHPPEVKAGAPWSARGDQYALALVACELFGVPTSAPGKQALKRALKDDPAERFVKVSDFADAMQPSSAASSPARLWSIAAGLCMVCAVGVWGYRSLSENEVVSLEEAAADPLQERLQEVHALLDLKKYQAAEDKLHRMQVDLDSQGRDELRLDALEAVVRLRVAQKQAGHALALALLIESAARRTAAGPERTAPLLAQLHDMAANAERPKLAAELAATIRDAIARANAPEELRAALSAKHTIGPLAEALRVPLDSQP